MGEQEQGTEQEEQKQEEEQDLSKVTAEKRTPSIEATFVGSRATVDVTSVLGTPNACRKHVDLPRMNSDGKLTTALHSLASVPQRTTPVLLQVAVLLRLRALGWGLAERSALSLLWLRSLANPGAQLEPQSSGLGRSSRPSSLHCLGD